MIDEQTPAEKPSAAPVALKDLTKQDIIDADDITIEPVDVPEWGGRVYVRVMDGPSRDAFELSMMKGRGKAAKMSMENVRAKCAAATICNAAGERLFSDKEIELLSKKSGAALNRVWEVSARLNGLTEKDVEELAGNSSGDHSDDLS